MFHSTDDAQSWARAGAGLPQGAATFMVAGDKLFAAQTDGLWWTQPAHTKVRSASWGQLKTRFHD